MSAMTCPARVGGHRRSIRHDLNATATPEMGDVASSRRLFGRACGRECPAKPGGSLGRWPCLGDAGLVRRCCECSEYAE
jgi:hypothetical protein